MHLVFATKNRRPLLADPALRAEMHTYLGGTCNRMKCPSLIVGGVEDHVHILANQARTVAISPFVMELKKASVRWMREKGDSTFGWQDGFGAFSFSKQDIPGLVQYVAHQEEHHRKSTLEEEYRKLLEEAGIRYDEKYLWG